jgi:pimeloyl-ACP methyl ester carboxylesterase
MSKKVYVLVAGAWCGAWAWQHVSSLLRTAGHIASPITLAGLGDRSQSSTDQIGLSTHVNDVKFHIEMEGFDDITLVGWSYGGMVATGVADSIPDRINSLIYLDAFVPEDGKALVDYLSAEGRAANELRAYDNEALPPLPLTRFGVTDQAVVKFVTPRLTHQPWRTFFDPLSLSSASSNIPKSYIRCVNAKLPHFDATLERVRSQGDFATKVIDADHFCPLTAPELTARHLLG